MGFNNHRGTPGHTIGADIMADDTPKGTRQSQGKANPNRQGPGPGLAESGRFRVGSNGGVEVYHTPKSASKKPESAPEEQLHIFRDAQEAHNHMGALLGVRMAEGARED